MAAVIPTKSTTPLETAQDSPPESSYYTVEIALVTCDITSSEPAVCYAPNAPNTSDDDRSQPERCMGTWSSGPKLEYVATRNKKLRWDGGACNLSREERKMTAIMRHCGRTRRWSTRRRRSHDIISGPWSAHLESRVGYVNERVGEKRRRKEWAEVQMLAIRGAKHVRAQLHLEALQALQWTGHMGAQPHQKPVHEMQRLRHLRAQPQNMWMMPACEP